jgi:hypothetical protein
VRILSVRNAAIASAILLSIPNADAQAQSGRAKAKTYRPTTARRATTKPRVNNVNGGHSAGFTSGYGTPVVGGTYIPGYGVTGGYPGSYPVNGGLYTPGFGVMGTPPTPVVGGSYVPGFGVMGGSVGSQSVVGGTYTPGYGVRRK